jgi:HAMP domain-containing protein
MRSFWNDLTFGVRTQLQTPVATAAVIATLAFGIAANVVAFALIDSFFLRPLPVREPERLVRIYSSSPGGMQYFTVSYGDYADMRVLTSVFERVVVEEPVPLTLGVAGSYERVWGARVSHDYFAMLGVAPARGRFFTQEEEAPGAAPVAVIGHGLWRRAFGGRDVLGDTMTVHGQRVTIVGIAGERFHGTTLGLFPDLWLPVIRDPETVLARGGGQFFVLARLQPGKSVAEANTALDLLAHRLEGEYAKNRGVRFPVLPESHGRVHPSARAGFLGVSGVFLVVAILVLVLACTNVAAILLARGFSRRAEIAVRLALGATRGRIAGETVRPLAATCGLGIAMGVALLVSARSVLQAVMVPPPGVAYPSLWFVGATAAVVLFAALALACYRPVRTAAATDPSVSLRVG